MLLKGLLEGVVVALEVEQLAFEEVNSMRANVVQEFPGVGYDHKGLRAVLNIILQPKNGIHVQMVRRLI
jgi:uncharacterized protein (UPF0335 family)